MNTTADRITEDLAILGRTSRERPTPLEVTLRAVGAAAPTSPPDLALVVFARVFVARVARTAAGVAALACMFAMLAWLAIPRQEGWIDQHGRDRTLSVELLETRRSWLGLLVVVVCLAVYVVTSGTAARAFERMVARGRDPIETACRLARRADGWAIAASITGIATFILGFGMLEVVVGDVGLTALFSRGYLIGSDTIEAIRHVMLASLGGAFAATAGGAIVVARNLGNARWLRNTAWMPPTGVALAFATFVLGVRFDAGPLFQTITNSAQPFVAVRVALTVAGMMAVFLMTTGLVLYRRHREEDVLGKR